MTLVPNATVLGRRRNCLEQTWAYLDAMLSVQEGLKVLLCDDATRGVLSVAYSQHQLLQHNVVLVDMLANKERYPMKHFACVVLCRPSSASLAALYQELAEGNFTSYAIFFSYLLDAALLQSLANADLRNLVTNVGEAYVDSIPVSEWVCITQLKPSPLRDAVLPLVNPISDAEWTAEVGERMVQSIVSMMLASNRRPVIRYRAGNPVIARLAGDVAARVKNVHALFPDLKATETVLLLLDRMDDPVTPLLMPWTYEAMIAELLGFQRGNEVVVDDPDAKPEERVHILTAHTDSFFGQHRYDDWGQVCIAVSEMVKAYKEMNNFDRNTVSLEEIRNFMSRFPEARTQSVQVTRHCAIASQLVAEINARNLTRLSVLEQDIVSSNNVLEHSRLLLEVVQDPKTDVDDALRLVMLYALHYEKTAGNILPQLKQELALRQCPQTTLDLIDRLLSIGGQERRVHEVFKSSTSQILKTVVKTVGQFGKEVQNVLTQHTPLLRRIINRVYNGTLSPETYPVQEVQGSPVPAEQAPFVRAKDILVVYIGGITYTERMLLWQLNQGTEDNKPETMMNIGKSVARRLGGESGPAASEPYTSKIEARVALLSTAMINSKDFVRSLPS